MHCDKMELSDGALSLTTSTRNLKGALTPKRERVPGGFLLPREEDPCDG